MLQQIVELICVLTTHQQAFGDGAVHAIQVGELGLRGHFFGMCTPVLQVLVALHAPAEVDQLIDIPDRMSGLGFQIGHQLLGYAHGQGMVAHGARQISRLKTHAQADVFDALVERLGQALLQLSEELLCLRIA